MKHFIIYVLSAVLTAVSAINLCAKPFSSEEGPHDADRQLTDYVNPFLGTATLWRTEDLGYERHKKARTWGAEVFPGAALPNAMVQVSPVTQFRSGAGYQYEDKVIYGFSHTNKGHWNLLHVPILPVTGNVNPDDYASPYSHSEESAHPGYYQVRLERYGVNAELTSTLRCAFHKYTFAPEAEKMLLADMTRNNNRVSIWAINKEGAHAFSGTQDGEGRIYFYAVTNYEVGEIIQRQGREHSVSLVSFKDSKGDAPLDVRIGFSFVSVENARLNLETEMLSKSFDEVRGEANRTWNELLSQIKVQGGTERQKGTFYSCLYRSFLWPCLRSDVNGEYTDARGEVVKSDFNYYTNPSFWDDYRNKLVLVELLRPKVAADIICSITDKGEKSNGYMPTFFHGDHASTFVAGSYARGVKGFDVERAYRLLLNNATVPGRGGRPYLDEYLANGWIAEKDTMNVPTWDEYKAAVTKTVEYAYDDYATALIADVVGDKESARLLRQHSMNYKNLFDPTTGFWRGRIADGSWIKDFDPYYPYFAYMFREANGWQSLFYAPHDPYGMVSLYPSRKAVEQKLDSLFTEPWRGYEAENFTGFIGNYCHGNQPDHSVPYVYCFIGKQPKCQKVLNTIMDKFYDMGEDHLALAGMDDAGEMSAWYVFNAIGIYTYSPADPEYIVTVPLFDRSEITLGDGRKVNIEKKGNGLAIKSVRCGGSKVKGSFVGHDNLVAAGRLVVTVGD